VTPQDYRPNIDVDVRDPSGATACPLVMKLQLPQPAKTGPANVPQKVTSHVSQQQPRTESGPQLLLGEVRQNIKALKDLMRSFERGDFGSIAGTFKE